jgi:hypothetical protein
MSFDNGKRKREVSLITRDNHHQFAKRGSVDSDYFSASRLDFNDQRMKKNYLN